MNFQNFKCRCSAIHKIMATSRSNPQLTEKQSEELKKLEEKDTLTEKQGLELARLRLLRDNSTKVILSDVAIDYLLDVYAWETEQMVAVDKELSYVQQIEKGKAVEEESITMFSRVEGVFYQKNTERVENEFLSGIPDIYHGESIYKAEAISDIKSIWDYPGFLKSIIKAAENGYKDQLGGYCDITGAKKSQIVRTLVTMPEHLRYDQAQRLMRKLGCISMESEDFIKEWAILERSMTFDHMDIQKRVYRLPVEPFTPERKQAVYDRVKVCREWLSNFHEHYSNLNK